MFKFIKKNIISILFAVASLVMILGIVSLVHHWQTDPEAICNVAGGFWGGVQGCENFCDMSNEYCPDKIIFGCWCGMDGCWDGKKCIVRNECQLISIHIQDAKNQVKDIENDVMKYATSSKDILGKSTEGGEQTNYTLNGAIVLIKQFFYGETGKSEISYYLQSGKVFYFTKKITTYSLPLAEDSSGNVKNVKVDDFYLGSNQNLCSWYSDQKIQPNDQGTINMVNDLISEL
jgi:hypothetical protein